MPSQPVLESSVEFTLSGEDRSHKVAGAALWEWDPEKA